MNLVFATASQLAQMIREGEVSVMEVVNAYLEQIAKYNNQIKAIANALNQVVGNLQHPSYSSITNSP